MGTRKNLRDDIADAVVDVVADDQSFIDRELAYKKSRPERRAFFRSLKRQGISRKRPTKGYDA